MLSFSVVKLSYSSEFVAAHQTYFENRKTSWNYLNAALYSVSINIILRKNDTINYRIIALLCLRTFFPGYFKIKIIWFFPHAFSRRLYFRIQSRKRRILFYGFTWEDTIRNVLKWILLYCIHNIYEYCSTWRFIFLPNLL